MYKPDRLVSLALAAAFILGCGGITEIDSQPYNCGGRSCASDEVCVTRGYLMIYLIVPRYEKSTGCEKKTGIKATSEPYSIQMPDGSYISRGAYAALPDAKKARNPDGTIRDPDALWQTLTGG